MADVAENTIVDGRYRITGKIGSGGMADVYCAEDTHLGREVALKVLYRRFAQDEEFVERFRREAKSAASLQHPNVVNVFDRGEHDGTYYIAMERLRGRTLKQIVSSESPLDELRVIDIACKILRAAGFAHSRGVIHRDFKPQNIMVDDAGSVKVTDFGIARAGASEITETGSIMGTAQYLSPEQAQGQAVTPRSDLYSIAVILYELLAGLVPFQGDSAVSIALRHLNDAPEPLVARRPDIHPGLEQVVLRGLAKDPAQRFQSAEEMIAALNEVAAKIEAGDRGGSDTMSYNAAYASAAGFDTSGEPAEAEEEPGERRRGRAAFLALLLLLLTGGGILAWALTRAEPVAVPDVVGEPLLQAAAKIEAAGLEVEERRVRDVAPEDEVIRQNPGGGGKADEGSTVTLFVSSGPGQVRVPSVDGLSEEDAVEDLNDAGFKVTVDEEPHDRIEDGFAIRTAPEGGERADRGSRIRLLVSSGPEQVTVPDVTGSTQSSAESTLQARGLLVKVEERESEARAGVVLSQTPAGGTKVDRGDSVTIVVAKEVERVPVPSVVGRSPAQARAALRSAGFRVLLRTQPVESEADDGVIVDQRPAAGSEVRRGGTVTIFEGEFTEPTPKGQPDPEPAP